MLDSDIKGMTNSGNGQQVGIGNINNNHVEYAAKYERYKELRNKKLYCPYLWSNAFEDCSATKVRNRLIEELMDMYLSDKSWYGRR